MQNWKLIGDTAQTTIPQEGGRSASKLPDIADAGFASTSHPKLKFNFTVDIELRVTLDGSGSSTFGSNQMDTFGIPLKTATRPTPSIIYTDVNYYNYRTKVATRTDYGTVSLTFYDDANNQVQNLYNTYLSYVSPISGVSAFELDNAGSVPFGQLSSIGPLPSNAKNGLIRVIRLHHFYKSGNQFLRTTYTCMNPKINSFQPDDLSMSESDVNTVTLEFNYDGLNISTVEV